MLPTIYQGKKAFRPVVLNSIGLTNKPNIPGASIGVNTRQARYAGSLARSPSAVRILAINEAVTKKMRDAGFSHDAAFSSVRKESPELFQTNISQ